MKRGVGYIIGNGNEFFGSEYENILSKVSDRDFSKNLFSVFYSIGEVENTNRTENKFYPLAKLDKENIINKVDNLVQLWLYDVGFNECTVIDYIYPKLEETWTDYKVRKNGFELAFYDKDCFIESHTDGISNGRICVLICYLSRDWEKGMGGELIITDINGDKIEVEPIFGNFVIFNFKEANLEHEVKKVTDDNFIRKSLIQIITEEN